MIDAYAVCGNRASRAHLVFRKSARNDRDVFKSHSLEFTYGIPNVPNELHRRNRSRNDQKVKISIGKAKRIPVSAVILHE
jgi:hypothetical protein